MSAAQTPPQIESKASRSKQIRSSKANTNKELKELQIFKSEDEMNRFFDDEKFRKYHYLTYEEYIEIFGKTVDLNFLPRVNKKIIYSHFDYFNYCYSQTWEYKWYPILAVFSINLRKCFPLWQVLDSICEYTVRLRSTSIIGTIAYLYTFDRFFENFFLHRNSQTRIMEISSSFSYHLNKKKFIDLRNKYIEKYVQIVNRNIAAGVYTSFDESKIQKVIKVGKDQNKIKEEDSEIDQQMEYDAFTTISVEEIQKKEEERNIKKMQSNKAYSIIKSTKSVIDSVIQSNFNFNSAIDQFFKIGVYDVMRKAQNSFNTFKTEFASYKQAIGNFPTRSDYSMLFYYKDLNKNKVYIFTDLLRERVNESVDLFNYIIRGRVTKSNFNLSWIHPERIDVNPSYKLDSYAMDFLTFTAICCLPIKVIRMRQKISQLLMKARQQKQKFLNI